MSKSSLIYHVGPHYLCIINNSDIDVIEGLPSLKPFAVSASDNEELLFTLHLAETDVAGTLTGQETSEDINFEWEDAQCLIRPTSDHTYLVAITPRDNIKTYWMECTDSFRHCTAYLSINGEENRIPASTINFVLNNFLMMLYAFNGARHHTLLMHASVIAHNGKGYLFLGKSGTGKSTHTSLWLKHIEGCHLLNDDNPVVHVNSSSKQVTVFGSPWSGKTPCYRNESVLIGAFVRLEQAPQNDISQENAVRAFAALLPSCSCFKQDKDIYNGIISTVTELASFSPVFHLKCLPDKEAAELCLRTVNDK